MNALQSNSNKISCYLKFLTRLVVIKNIIKIKQQRKHCSLNNVKLFIFPNDATYVILYNSMDLFYRKTSYITVPVIKMSKIMISYLIIKQNYKKLFTLY